jgi:glucose/arabinose dehydrogenase
MDGSALNTSRRAFRIDAFVAYASLACAALTLCTLPVAPAHAQFPIPNSGIALPAQFASSNVVAGLVVPTAFTFLPTGEVLIAEQGGVVKRAKDGKLDLEPVIDLSAEVNSAVERGLLGMAADPDFERNGTIYLLYTYDKPGDEPDGHGLRFGKLVRYTVRDGRADPKSAFVLLDGFESDMPYHAVGGIRFARDGAMFVSFGDSSNPYEVSDLSLRSQDLDRLQGKLIRIDRDGSAVADNPFYDSQQPNSVRSKVWAYGFRNPYRFQLHPTTQIPYVGNVGWSMTESLVRAPRGVNFGWPCFESARRVPEFASKPSCTSLAERDLVRSDYDYTHDGDNAAIVAGDFNISDAFPADMRGDFFFGDYSKRFIRRARLDEQGRVTQVEDFAPGAGNVVDLQFGPDGALYYLDIYAGLLHRIAYEPNLHAPAAQLSIVGSIAQPAAGQPIIGNVPFTITFSAARSSDLDDELLTYVWDFESSASGLSQIGSRLVATSTPTITHTYARAGAYTARLTVVDGVGWTDSAEQRILVRDTKPRAEIVSPSDGDTFLVGEQVTLRGRGFDVDGAILPAAQLTWTVDLHDLGQRRTLATGKGESISFVMPAASPGAPPERLEEASSIAVTLHVTDKAGNTGATRMRLWPQPRDGYIRSWWLIGGFPQRSLFDDMLPGGEANFILAEGGDGARLIYSPSRKIDLGNYIQPPDNNLAYAFIWVHSPTERDGLLGMNSDDGIAVWLNGREVWRNKVSRYVPDDTRDLDLPKIHLKKGLNSILVKVNQDFGEWAFKLRVLNPNGSIMRDATVRTQPLAPI